MKIAHVETMTVAVPLQEGVGYGPEYVPEGYRYGGTWRDSVDFSNGSQHSDDKIRVELSKKRADDDSIRTFLTVHCFSMIRCQLYSFVLSETV